MICLDPRPGNVQVFLSNFEYKNTRGPLNNSSFCQRIKSKKKYFLHKLKDYSLEYNNKGW